MTHSEAFDWPRLFDFPRAKPEGNHRRRGQSNSEELVIKTASKVLVIRTQFVILLEISFLFAGAFFRKSALRPDRKKSGRLMQELCTQNQAETEKFDANWGRKRRKMTKNGGGSA